MYKCHISGNGLCFLLSFSSITIYTERKTHEFIQEIAGWKDERYVRDHVNHARPIHGRALDVVILGNDVRYYAELDPLHGIARAVQDEYYQDQPSFAVDFSFDCLLSEEKNKKIRR